MRSKVYKVILILGLIYVIGFLGYLLFIPQEKDISGIAKCVLVLITYLVALFRRRKGRLPKGGYALYESQYKDIVGGTFEGDKRSYRKLLKATVYYNMDQFKKAHRLLDELLKKCKTSKDYMAVYMFHAFCYSDEKRCEDTIEAYQKVLQYDMCNSKAWSNLGLEYDQVGRTREAEDAYKNAILYDPENPYAYSNLANHYIRKGEAQLVLVNAEKALELNSNLHPAMSAMSMAYKMLGDEENAEKYCKLYGVIGGDAQSLKARLATI